MRPFIIIAAIMLFAVFLILPVAGLFTLRVSHSTQQARLQQQALVRQMEAESAVHRARSSDGVDSQVARVSLEPHAVQVQPMRVSTDPAVVEVARPGQSVSMGAHGMVVQQPDGRTISMGPNGMTVVNQGGGRSVTVGPGGAHVVRQSRVAVGPILLLLVMVPGGLILLIILLATRGGRKGSDASHRHTVAGASAPANDEAAVIRDLLDGLDRMAGRVESLETILVERSRRGG